MITTVPAEEVLALVHATHGKPRSVLGLHLVDVRGKPTPVVRVLAPQAREVAVVDVEDSKAVLAERVHPLGLFEAIFFDRYETFDYRLRLTGGDGRQVETDDPYLHPERITAFDRYLFNRAIHYRAWEKMGAHSTTSRETAGVHFSVWAPNAVRVSVVGDFNRWDGRRHPMQLHEDAGVWELFVPDLDRGEIYKYEIKDRAGNVFMKADPYARRCELRPQTGSVVAGRLEHDWGDADWLEQRRETDWQKRPMLVYEVHPGSWRRESDEGGEGDRVMTYRELAAELIPYVLERGFTHLELMGIQEHPFDGSWGYQVTGYFAPTARYGSPEDFMHFVDQCHRQGLGVILDWVPGHFPKDAHALAEFDGTALYEHADPRQGEHPDWGTKVFNYGRMEVQSFLISNALFWLDVYHLDGLRVDAVASMLYLDYSRAEGQWIPNRYGGRENLEAVEFLKHLNSAVHERCPGALMIAEESTSWPRVSGALEDGGLGFDFKWNMGWMHDTLSYLGHEPVHRKHHHDELTFTTIYAFSESFLLPFSHDEVVHGKGSLLSRMPGDEWRRFANLRLLYTFQATFPGKTLLFMGSELGQWNEWNDAASLDWELLEHDPHRGVWDLVRDLNRLVRSRGALHELDAEPTGFRWINGADAENSVWTFIRQGEAEDDHLVVVLNFTPEVRHGYRIGVPAAGPYRELLNSDDKKYSGSGVTNAEVTPEAEEYFGFPYSCEITLPPLAGSVLAPAAPGE